MEHSTESPSLLSLLWLITKVLINSIILPLLALVVVCQLLTWIYLFLASGGTIANIIIAVLVLLIPHLIIRLFKAS